MIVERLEQRVLGAIEFVDALTGARIRHALRAHADQLRLTLNPSWLYVIRDANGLAAHTESFEAPPGSPAFQSLTFALTVTDPQRQYLARRCEVKLPRKNQPLSDADSVLRPVQIELYPSMARPVEPTWASARVLVYTIVDTVRVPVANALLTLTPDLGGSGPVRALTDASGEALLAVIGVPPVIPSGGAVDDDPDVVYTRQFSATLVVVLDDDVVRRGDAAALPLPDPDLIEARLGASNPSVHEVNPPAFAMSAGVTKRVEVQVSL